MVAWLLACSSTSRPPFQPIPEARTGEVELEVAEATAQLARQLTAAGIPVSRVAPRDGYLETRWFDTTTGAARGAPSSGAGGVRVRGWVRPSRPGSSELTVEAVYRPFADPSLAPRELERSVPYAHPTRARIRAAFAALGAATPVEEPDAITLAQRRAPKARADTARRVAPAVADSVPPVADAAPPPRDSVPLSAQPPRAVDAARARADTSVRARPDSARTPRAGYSIQVAATADRDVADLASARVREMGLAALVVREGSMFRVRTAAYPTAASAETVLRRLRGVFPDAFVVRR